MCFKKMSIEYQKLFLATRGKDSAALNFCADARKFKVKEAARNFSEPPLLLTCVFVTIYTVDKRCASRLVAQAKAGYANRLMEERK